MIEIIKIIVSALAGAFLVHFFNQRRENKIKNYEARKPEYFEFIDSTLNIFKASLKASLNTKNKASLNIKNSTLNSKELEELNKELEKLNHLSLKLAIVGSKEFYESYLFFRWIGQIRYKTKQIEDEAVKSIYNAANELCSDKTLMFVMGEMFQTIRKEISLDTLVNKIKKFVFREKIDVLDILDSFLTDLRARENFEEFEQYNKNKPELKRLYLKHKNPYTQLK